MEWISFLPTAIGIVTVVVGAVLVGKSQAIKTALENYKELAKSYEEKTKDLSSKITELQSETAQLRGELKVFKNTPLRDINKSVNALISNQIIVMDKVDRIEEDTTDIKKELGLA